MSCFNQAGYIIIQENSRVSGGYNRSPEPVAKPNKSNPHSNWHAVRI